MKTCKSSMGDLFNVPGDKNTLRYISPGKIYMTTGIIFRVNVSFSVKTGIRAKGRFLVVNPIGYIYAGLNKHPIMFLKKHTAYLLFIVAYIGALIIEKPVYAGETIPDCFSYLFTILVHFSLFTLMIVGNNALLIPHLLEKKRFGWYAAGLLSLVWLYTLLINRYNAFIHEVLFHDQLVKTSAGFWDNFVYALCCTVIASMLYITQRWSEQQEQMKNSQINQLQTELKYLRSQINPHFLFNGLNTVYGYIDRSNNKARDMMVQFSDLLRYNLYEADVDMIALEKEIKYLQNYVALQKARSNDNLEVTLHIDYQNGMVKVAPLIFMAFVENAFKYVSRDDSAVNSIAISLTEKSGEIDFTCDNSYDETASSPGGIGLNNAVRRLELLYKDRYQLNIKKENNKYQVHLTLAS
ncbi:sensor histidine kinase [Chitinophaga sp. 22321]|uniref:Histidine kinase n=1 Tax=Chitinophaga hostae TaxID=2831022 RepID=A0ABS5IW30_9BACT|nr:histidine kinase [Chitinophaga hostae]MBS0027159.1 histidine kinase [Chitinophaga hostae]